MLLQQGEVMKGLLKFLIIATGIAVGALAGVLLAPHDLVGNVESMRGIAFVGGGAFLGLVVGCAGIMMIE
jgi:hypothetical protein